MGLLDGKVVIVTGAGGGIGREHALACARAGARVVVNDVGGARDGSGASAAADVVAAEIRALGGDAVANTDSVTDAAGCDRMVAAAAERWGRLDAIVNNAGILRDRSFVKMTDAEWFGVLDVHLNGTRNLCRAALPLLQVQGGAIVNTTSTSGMLGNFGQANYAAAKAGVYGLTRVLALELEKKGIAVNCVAPIAKTRMTEDIDRVPAEWTAAQVSPIVVFLVSDLARGVTGRVFGVRGQRLHLYEVKVNAGVEKAGDEPWTPEEIASRLGEIVSWDPPRPASPPVAAPPRSPVGKRYDGGHWLVDRAEWLAYAAATDDANPALLDVAPPMYHVRPFIGLMLKMATDPELGLDFLRLVHGEHDARFLRPLRHGEVLTLRGRLLSLDEKPSGTVARFSLVGLVDGEPAVDAMTTYFVRAASPPAARPKGEERPPAAAPPEPPPPDLVFQQSVSLDQATRYAAASGDDNAIHLDPEVARRGGLPGVILHGLCTMAFAQRDLVASLCEGDPTRLARLAVRFARPVFPGQALLLEVWRRPGGAEFVTRNGEGQTVIAQGRAEIR
jgi:NAD(P)-dependent dehydrogenase (short-subunit alcohol dehydrogenase family)/acyl dehydratase